MKNITLYIFLVLFIVMNVVFITTAKKYEPEFNLKYLVIENNKIIPTEILIEFVNIKDKETLSSLTAEMIIDRIEKHPYVKKAEGSFVDSNTFMVRIEEVEPFVMIISNNRNFIMTKDKKLIPDDIRLNILDLPVVTLDVDLENIQLKNSKLFDLIFNSFENLHNVDKALFEIISELNVNKNFELTFYLTKPRGKILIGKEINLTKAIYLSEFWRKVILTNPVNEYEYIDLRFNDQIVVKFSNTKIS